MYTECTWAVDAYVLLFAFSRRGQKSVIKMSKILIISAYFPRNNKFVAFASKRKKGGGSQIA